MREPTEDSRFAEIVRAELAPIRQYVRRRVPPDDVDDIVSEVFAAAWKHRRRLPDPPRFWLLRTAWFHVGMHLRRRHRQARLVDRIAGLPDENAAGPEETVVGGAEIRAALAQLPPLDQEVLRLMTWEDLTTAQAAEVLVCSQIAVRTRLHRARRRLARLLDDPPEPATSDRSASSVGGKQGEQT